MTENTKIALISDFDGTISKFDFFWYAIDKLLKKEDLQPWNDYIDHKITHVQALARIFEKIHIPKDEFDKFVLDLPLDEYFVSTVEFCKKNKIDIYILSAGAAYYIKKILSKLGIEDALTIIGNPSIYNEEEGLKFIPVNKELYYYSEEFGISKCNFVKEAKKKYEKIVFAGDGIPDIEAAKQADTVFAKGSLLELCQKANVKTMKFDSFKNVLDYLKTITKETKCLNSDNK